MRSRYPGLKRPRSTRLYVRHHCRECNGRVFPFDKYEGDTEAPVPGKSGKRVLLVSRNSNNPDDRLAWCWSCRRIVQCHRLKETEILMMYLKRRGVVRRPPRPAKRKRQVA